VSSFGSREKGTLEIAKQVFQLHEGRMQGGNVPKTITVQALCKFESETYFLHLRTQKHGRKCSEECHAGNQARARR
jgi:hypothetical protein